MPRFEASALRGYCVSVLTASGVERSCAEAVADALIDAELTGVSTHGVSRLAVYMQRMDAGVMSRENNIRIVRESTSTLVVDAGNSLGAAAAKFAMERCIAKAKETGCCFASVHSSNHFGTAAYYTRLAAAQDMIGFACTNLKGKIAAKKAPVVTVTSEDIPELDKSRIGDAGSPTKVPRMFPPVLPEPGVILDLGSVKANAAELLRIIGK